MVFCPRMMPQAHSGQPEAVFAARKQAETLCVSAKGRQHRHNNRSQISLFVVGYLPLLGNPIFLLKPLSYPVFGDFLTHGHVAVARVHPKRYPHE